MRNRRNLERFGPLLGPMARWTWRLGNWFHLPENMGRLAELLVDHYREEGELDTVQVLLQQYAELREQGVRVGRKRVARLMKQADIRGDMPKRFVRTTDSKHDKPVAPNLLNREFKAESSDAVWCADITYIPTNEGWLYLAAVMDLYSRKIAGWSMKTSLHRDIVIDALLMAVWRRKPKVVTGLAEPSTRVSRIRFEKN